MGKRERFLEWLRHGSPDQVPVLFGPCHFEVASARLGKPQEQVTWPEAIAVAEETGTHLLQCVGSPLPFDAVPFLDDLEIRTVEETRPDGTPVTRRFLKTPAGTLTEAVEHAPQTGSCHTEFFVKDDRDLPAFACFIRKATEAVVRNPAVRRRVSSDIEREKAVGDGRLPTLLWPFCAAVELTSSYYMDQATAIKAVIDVVRERAAASTNEGCGTLGDKRMNPVQKRDEQPAVRNVAMPPKDRLHVYLLIGQSNMVGRDRPRPLDRRTQPRILMLGTDLQWAPAADHLPHEEGACKGVGPGMSFARRMAERAETATIGLVAAAWGGTPISRWVKGADLYEKAIALARFAQRDGVLKGILWMQGESDSCNLQLATSYRAKLVRLIGDLRDELGAPGVPFLIGEIGQFEHPDFPHYQTVNEALRAVAAEVPNAGFVSVRGVTHMGDQAHLDVPSQRRMGKAFAAEMLRLQSALEGKKCP
jgi:hypothetical protein